MAPALGTLEAITQAQAASWQAFLTSLKRAGSHSGGTLFGESFRIWTQTIDQASQMTAERASMGEGPPVEDLVNLWTNAYADAIKPVLGSPLYAAAQGETVDAALDARKRLQEQAEHSLRAVGISTRSDLLEVGQRLIELERRQQRVETLLRDIHAKMPESGTPRG
ncbi:MAG: poly(R)-hydroxyalkanoic acid synthase subunit PhaE [Candidatus Thermoplasmatota archaeon]